MISEHSANYVAAVISLSKLKLAMTNTQVSVRFLLIRPLGVADLLISRVHIGTQKRYNIVKQGNFFRNSGAQITRVTRVYVSKLGDSPRLRAANPGGHAMKRGPLRAIDGNVNQANVDRPKVAPRRWRVHFIFSARCPWMSISNATRYVGYCS